jgi:type IV secretory pathway VirB10-like protein
MRNFFSRSEPEDKGNRVLRPEAQAEATRMAWRKPAYLFGGCVALLLIARACNSHQETALKSLKINREQEQRTQAQKDSDEQINLLRQQLEAANMREAATRAATEKETETALHSLNPSGITPEQQRQLQAVSGGSSAYPGVQQQNSPSRGAGGGGGELYNLAKREDRPVSLIVSYRSDEDEVSKPKTSESRGPKEPASNPETKVAPSAPEPTGPLYRLRPGTLLPCTQSLRLNGAFAGNINCLISIPVYSASGNHLLIPQGSLALGKVTKVESTNQERLFVAFQQIILPDGTPVQIKNESPGLDQIGQVGLKDKVNRHTMKIFGTSLAIAAIGGLAQIGNSGGYYSPMDQYRAGVGASISQSSMQILSRRLDTLPSFTIREGARNNLYLEHELQLPDYTRQPRMEDQ